MRDILLGHWGKYCSYCELPIVNQPGVDHVIPQGRFPEYRDLWENHHLSCSHCNSRKGAQLPTPDAVDDFLWPTRDNTALAFKYVNVFPEVADCLTNEQQEMARRLHNLLKLDATGDVREEERRQAYVTAIHWRSQLATAKDPKCLRDAVVDIARLSGFFSIWMEVFSNDKEMRKQLIAAFPGTAKDCFNADAEPVPRPNGRV
ncbi:MAG TPA: HNH endonuclease [Polyangium sp.]|nr:HNH endonuclease [Polyangium sp.]